MPSEFTDANLEAYLDEGLEADTAARLESELRSDSELLKRLSHITNRRESGLHSLGDIWRRNQLGVPSRKDLGSFLLGVLPDEHANYIRFRVDVLKCPYTIANLRDLEAEQSEASEKTATRRKRYFETSAGYLDGQPEEE